MEINSLQFEEKNPLLRVQKMIILPLYFEIQLLASSYLTMRIIKNINLPSYILMMVILIHSRVCKYPNLLSPAFWLRREGGKSIGTDIFSNIIVWSSSLFLLFYNFIPPRNWARSLDYHSTSLFSNM